jgi:hypothetical protein
MIRSDDGRGGREPWSGRKRGERADALPRVELVAVDAFQLEWTTVEKKDAFRRNTNGPEAYIRGVKRNYHASARLWQRAQCRDEASLRSTVGRSRSSSQISPRRFHRHGRRLQAADELLNCPTSRSA